MSGLSGQPHACKVDTNTTASARPPKAETVNHSQTRQRPGQKRRGSPCPGLEKALGAVEMLLVPSDRKYFDSPASVAELVPKLPVSLGPAMHMQALPHREVAAVIRTVRESAAVPAARLALEFLVLTAARWGEVRWADGRPEAGDGRDPVKRASISAAGWRKFHSRLPSSGRSRRKYPCGKAVKS